MFKLICATLLLICVLQECNASCSYQGAGGECIFLDNDSQQCNQCTTFSDNLVNSIPTSIAVNNYTGACGCVVVVSSRCISLLNTIDPNFLTTDCTRTGQTFAANILNNQPCNGCDVSNPAPDPAGPTTPKPSAPTPNAPTPDVPTPTPDAPTPANGCRRRYSFLGF